MLIVQIGFLVYLADFIFVGIIGVGFNGKE